MTNATPPAKPDLNDPAQFVSAVYRDLLNQSGQIMGLRILLEQAERDASERADTAKKIEKAVNNLLKQSEDTTTQIAEMKREMAYLKHDSELTKQQVQVLLANQQAQGVRSRWDVIVPIGLIISMSFLALAIVFWVFSH